MLTVTDVAPALLDSTYAQLENVFSDMSVAWTWQVFEPEGTTQASPALSVTEVILVPYSSAAVRNSR
jgi:hypothetical protein